MIYYFITDCKERNGLDNAEYDVNFHLVVDLTNNTESCNFAFLFNVEKYKFINHVNISFSLQRFDLNKMPLQW